MLANALLGAIVFLSTKGPSAVTAPRGEKLKRRDWVWILLVFFCTWCFDHASKLAMRDITSSLTFGPFGIRSVQNPGMFLGSFSQTPNLVRTVGLATAGAFVMALYGMFLWLIPSRAFKLRLGLTLLTAGIIGNVTDRILWGYVLDFLAIGIPGRSVLVINLADIAQWGGYGLIIAAIFQDHRALWSEANIRKSLWVDHRFQIKFSAILFLCGFALSGILGVFSYTFLVVAFQVHEFGQDVATKDSLIHTFVVTFVFVSILFCLVLFVVGFIFSNRLVGPLYAFERFMEDFIRGKSIPLKLREGDQFSELETLSKRVIETLVPRQP